MPPDPPRGSGPTGLRSHPLAMYSHLMGEILGFTPAPTPE